MIYIYIIKSKSNKVFNIIQVKFKYTVHLQKHFTT